MTLSKNRTGSFEMTITIITIATVTLQSLSPGCAWCFLELLSRVHLLIKDNSCSDTLLHTHRKPNISAHPRSFLQRDGALPLYSHLSRCQKCFEQWLLYWNTRMKSATMRGDYVHWNVCLKINFRLCS